jgi:hypothetical protein
MAQHENFRILGQRVHPTDAYNLDDTPLRKGRATAGSLADPIMVGQANRTSKWTLQAVRRAYGALRIPFLGTGRSDLRDGGTGPGVVLLAEKFGAKEMPWLPLWRMKS